jgi:hypothetical protein
MSETNNNQEFKAVQRKKLRRKLDEIGWGLFFIWIGIAFLADVGWGVGLIGVGTIILGGLVAREYLSGSTCYGTTKANC